MVIRRIVIASLLNLGFHKWEYSAKRIARGITRYCIWSGKKQIYIKDVSISAISGDFNTWVDIGNEFDFNNHINTDLPINERIKQAPYSVWLPDEKHAVVNATAKYRQFEEITFETIEGMKYRIHKIYTDVGTQETVHLER